MLSLEVLHKIFEGDVLVYDIKYMILFYLDFQSLLYMHNNMINISNGFKWEKFWFEMYKRDIKINYVEPQLTGSIKGIDYLFALQRLYSIIDDNRYDSIAKLNFCIKNKYTNYAIKLFNQQTEKEKLCADLFKKCLIYSEHEVAMHIISHLISYRSYNDYIGPFITGYCRYKENKSHKILKYMISKGAIITDQFVTKTIKTILTYKHDKMLKLISNQPINKILLQQYIDDYKKSQTASKKIQKIFHSKSSTCKLNGYN